MSSVPDDERGKDLDQEQEKEKRINKKGEQNVEQGEEVEEEEEQLQDLETSLLALEKLDRASPDLWPDHSKKNNLLQSFCEFCQTWPVYLLCSLVPVPGVSQFAPLETPHDSPANLASNNVLAGLTQDDLGTINQLGGLPVTTILNEVKRLHDVAYELGIEERKEMTRGKYLNIFKKNN